MHTTLILINTPVLKKNAPPSSLFFVIFCYFDLQNSIHRILINLSLYMVVYVQPLRVQEIFQLG